MTSRIPAIFTANSVLDMLPYHAHITTPLNNFRLHCKTMQAKTQFKSLFFCFSKPFAYRVKGRLSTVGKLKFGQNDTNVLGDRSLMDNKDIGNFLIT